MIVTSTGSSSNPPTNSVPGAAGVTAAPVVDTKVLDETFEHRDRPGNLPDHNLFFGDTHGCGDTVVVSGGMRYATLNVSGKVSERHEVDELLLHMFVLDLDVLAVQESKLDNDGTTIFKQRVARWRPQQKADGAVNGRTIFRVRASTPAIGTSGGVMIIVNTATVHASPVAMWTPAQLVQQDAEAEVAAAAARRRVARPGAAADAATKARRKSLRTTGRHRVPMLRLRSAQAESERPTLVTSVYLHTASEQHTFTMA